MSYNIRQTVYVITFTVAFISFGLWLSNVMDYSGRDYYVVDSSWVEDTGVLVQLEGGHSSSKFSYVYKDTPYVGYSHLNYSKYNAVIGDRVILKINPKHPDKYMPIDWKVVFVQCESTDTTIGTITDISTGESFNKVNRIGQSHTSTHFEYAALGQIFERSITVPPYLENSPNIKVGARFQVEYLKDNPLRGIIHYDRPR